MPTRCDFCEQPLDTAIECSLCRREREQLAADRNAEWWS